MQQVVHEKPETRRPVVFKHKTWDEQWVPTDEFGKQVILLDRRAEVEQHDNDVYVGEVLYFLEMTHTSPSVPDLILAVCRLHAAERMVIGTGCIVEDVRQALFRGQATNSHIRVHPEQPQGEDAFGYAFADILNNCAEPKQYDVAGKKHLLEAAKDKAVLSAVLDECWPCDTQTAIPYPLKKTHRFSIAAPPYTERICYTTFNYCAGYTADNVVYAKEAVFAAFREYTPSPSLPTPLRPSLWVVLTVHLVMYRKQGNVRNYPARYYFQDEGKDGQGGRKKGPLPSADGLAKALDLAEAWHQSELGRYYQAGKCPPANVMFKGEEVCEVTPHWEAAAQQIVSLPLVGTAASPKLHGLVGVLAQQQKRAGGIIKHNTNAVKNLADTQAVPGDNVDEGSSPEPPAKNAKQPAKPAAGGLAQGRGGAGARAGGGALGSRAGRRAAVAAAATREQQAGRQGGPSQNRM
eukprot:jgi/Tetstr1/441783/TSEL_030000.t1